MAGEDGDAETVRRQRAALARFSKHALRTTDLDALLCEAVELVSETTGVGLAKVLQLMPDGETMLVRAGVNWKPGVVGNATLRAHGNSPGGYALQTSEPVISPDVATERRFAIPDLLREHGIASMINVIIEGDGPPWGVLEVDSPEGKTFTKDDVDFLQTFANLVAAAIERQQAHKERQRAAERSDMLLRELRHRVGNLLANIQAMARRTQKTSSSLEEFADAFEDRLAALGRTQELLTRDVGCDVNIREVLKQELDAHGAEHGDGRLTVEGPDVLLPPEIAQALSMGFHELATNASKHGALGWDGGHLHVSWEREASPEGSAIVITWRETGVRIADRPERRGFGTEVIEQALPRMLDGTCTRTFHGNGIECVIRFAAPESAASRATMPPENSAA